jgi:two-component system, NarL family, sensor kinase
MKANDHSNITILKEIAELLNEETNMEKMLDGALTKFIEGTKFDTGWIFFINEKGKSELVAHVNLPAALASNECGHLRKGGCWCVSRFRNEQLERASNIIECQRIEAAVEEHEDNAGVTHHSTVPLQVGNERFGLLNVASKYTTSFEAEDLELLESVAFQLGSAIKRIHLTQEQQEIALVQERNRLARDLHDSVNQLLFSVTLTSRAGIEMTNEPELKETFREIQSLTQEALTEMRALIWQLRPQGLESGLIEAIKNYAEMLGIVLHTNVTGVIQLPSRIEETLFRIAQEALNNVRRHAGVKEATLLMQLDAKHVTLTIADEGRGFIISNRGIPSLGLQSIKDRVKALKGTAVWQSELGKGTTIIITLPY